MTTLINAGTDNGLTAYRNPFSPKISEPGKVVAVSGAAARVAQALRMKAAEGWTGYGSPISNVFVATYDTVDPWMLPVQAHDDDWLPMSAEEMEEFAA